MLLGFAGRGQVEPAIEEGRMMNGPSPRRQFALVAATLVVAFVLARAVSTGTAEPRVSGTEVIELRSPEALAAKLEYLRTFDGYKCVLVGDSIIVGQSMREHGDADWRAH